MGRQSFTLKYIAIGGGVLLEIPRNHLDGTVETDGKRLRSVFDTASGISQLQELSLKLDSMFEKLKSK